MLSWISVERFAVIILGTLLLDLLLSIVSETLNLRALNREIPDEFKDLIDENTYRESRKYTLATTKFGMVTQLFNLAVLLIFWFSGGFNWLDQLVRSWEYSLVVRGLLFIGILILLKMVISLPFSIYSTFVIEERFGFNKTTPSTFVTDYLKSLMLTVVLGAPLLAGIIAFFEYGGSMALLWAWGVIIVYTLVIQYVAPTWIMPLFNKFEPLEDGDLRQMIRDYAARVHFPLQGIYVIDGSKRSSKSNAFFTGFGRNKRIALFDTLIDRHSRKELLAVLAHEIGHYKKKHIIKNLLISTLHTGIMLALLSLFLNMPGLYDAFYMEEMSVYTGLVFFGLLYAPIDMILSAGLQLLSRKYEFETDAFAADTTEDPESMVEVLKKTLKRQPLQPDPAPLLRLVELLALPRSSAHQGDSQAFGAKPEAGSGDRGLSSTYTPIRLHNQAGSISGSRPWRLLPVYQNSLSKYPVR